MKISIQGRSGNIKWHDFYTNDKIVDQIEEKTITVESKFKIPKYLVLTPMAYSNLISAINKDKDILTGEDLIKTYKNLEVVVIPSLPFWNEEYVPHLWVCAEPDVDNLFLKLNQEQFRKSE